jgi:hypothetical protein
LQQLLDRSALKMQVASRALPLMALPEPVARRNYRCRMHCRRDVLVASLSAHDPIPDTGMTVDRIGCCLERVAKKTMSNANQQPNRKLA